MLSANYMILVILFNYKDNLSSSIFALKMPRFQFNRQSFPSLDCTS